MTIQTRKPTGKPSWPMILLAGMEKSGKTYAAAAASGSDLIGRTFWLTVGEDDPDEYGPLGRFEIVQQDGTHRALVESIRAITAETAGDEKPALIVLDSASMLWQMLTDEAQQSANARRKRDEATITPDLWNTAAKRWKAVIAALRAHPGPVLITARLALVMEMEGEKPTGDKIWKIDGHKSLPYDVTAIVQMRSRSERYLTGVRSMRYGIGLDDVVPIPADLSIPDMWIKLGIAEATDRVHTSADGAQSLKADADARAALMARLEVVADVPRVREWWQSVHGHPIDEADIDELRDVVEQGEARHREKTEAEARATAAAPDANPTEETPAA